MLEIIILYFLCKNIGETMRNKGRTAIWMQIMMVCFWFCGECLGVFAAATYEVITTGNENMEMSPRMYLFALSGAILGTITTYVIAWIIPEA